MEERNDSAGETDEFRCAVCQMSNDCQQKNPVDKYFMVSIVPLLVPWDSEGLKYV